ncbi:MAG: HAD-IA family hydrolase [Candidatus Aenigmarchaeota archaeon]|nr:HAD-IA family hydrolase [Candidatus Aenigmarchaeota archaeon]
MVYDPSHEIHEKIAKILGFKNRHKFWGYLDENFFGTRMSFYDYIRVLIEERGLPEGTSDKIKSLWERAKKNIELYPKTIETLEKLSKKYKLVLLSNTAEEEGLEAIMEFELRKYFDEIIISGNVGLAKPDPRIFKLVLSKMEVKPEEVLVIGDSLEMDIIPARTLGMEGILVDVKEKYTEYENKDWCIKSLNELKL